MRSLLALLSLALALSHPLAAQAPRANPGSTLNLEFAVFLWPSAADTENTPLPVNPSPETVNEDGIAVTPAAEPVTPDPKPAERKLTPAEEEKLVRFAAGRDKGSFLPLLGGHTTPFLPYRGAPKIEFFREKKGADGRIEKTVVATHEFAATSKKVLLVFRSSDMNQTFEVDAVEVTDELLPKGRLLFVNGTEKTCELEVAGVKSEIAPRQSANGSLESLKDYKIPCKLSVRQGDDPTSGYRKVLGTNLYFARQDLRLVYLINEIKGSNRFELMAIDPFQASETK